MGRLEYHVREELNKTAPRTMVVLHPLKVHYLFAFFVHDITGYCLTLTRLKLIDSVF